MDPFSTSHFSHRALLDEARSIAAHDHATTAVLLSRIAEIDDRRLFLQEGYPSMHTCLVRDLGYCEQAAYKRLYAARAARRFPLLFVAVSEGRLQAVSSPASVPRMAQVPRDELSPGKVAGASSPGVALQLSPGKVEVASPSIAMAVPGPSHQLSPGKVESRVPPPKVTPLAPQRFGLQVTLDQETHDLLKRAQALMSHQNPSGEIAPVLKSALQLLVGQLEKRKFAATSRPGRSRPASSSRHIPAAVKREVRERDGAQCSFVSDDGRRCSARSMLEFDHPVPVAFGGQAIAENLRLLCRAHNQHAAEQAFGAEFMKGKKRDARGCRGSRHATDAASGEPL